MDPLAAFLESTRTKAEEKCINDDYVDSYVAFLDILGTRTLMDRPFQDVCRLFSIIPAGILAYSRMGIAGTRDTVVGRGQLRATIISDAVVVSISSSVDQSLPKLVGFTSYLINRFLTTLDKPIFLRGGISKGPVFHDGEMVFGPALVDAYELESRRAIAMRCIMSPSVVDDDPAWASVRETFIQDPDDHLYFVDFAKPEDVARLEQEAASTLESDDTDDIKEKHRWLLDYVRRAEP